MNDSLRALRRNPGFAALSILTVGIGAGAATAVFSVVDAVLLRPLPYPDSDRLAMLWESRPSTGAVPQNVTPRVYRAWRERARSFASVSAAIYSSPLLRHQDRSERIHGLRVSSNLFETLGVHPVLGRAFLPSEDAAGGPRTVILGDRVWRERFSADPRILGREVTLDGVPHTVIGVMPRGFRMQPAWAAQAGIWTTMSLEPELSDSWTFGALRSYARLKPGVSWEAARRELDAIAAGLNRQFPAEAGGRGASVESLRERTVGNVRSVLWMLAATVGCLLAAACINLANLLLIRASRRGKELAVRAALGASRLSLIGGILGEALTMGLLGAVFAAGFAAWTIELLPRLLPQAAQTVLPRLDEIAIDFRVLAFAAAIAVITSATAALVPAVRLLRGGPQGALRDSTRSSTGARGATRLRSALLGVEAAFTLVLLCAAALLVRSFGNLLSIDPGFRVANTLTFVVTQPRTAEPFGLARMESLRERLAALPGVRSAAIVNHIPVAGDEWGTLLHLPGVTSENLHERPRVVWRLAGRNYLTATGMSLRSGRNFNSRDRASSEPVALVNETLARRWFAGRDPVGTAIVVGAGERRVIAGVFADTRQGVWGDAPEPELILPVEQNRDWSGTRFLSFVLHTSVAPSTLIESARRAVAGFDSNLVPYDMASMEDIRAAAVARPRFSLLLLSLLAAVALGLAVVGLFAVVSYSVASRTREFGIRSALGARAGKLQAQVLREGLVPVSAGALAGLLAAFLLLHFYRDLLYRVDPQDPVSHLGALVSILAVAAAACWLPARRASRVPPATVLRNE